MPRPTEAPPAPTPCRPFTLGDAMIFVAALGVGLALARAAESPWQKLWESHRFPPGFRAQYAVQRAHAVLWFCVASLTFGWLVVRLRSPRPRALALLVQPGAVACGAAAVWFVAGLVALRGRTGSLDAFAFVMSPGLGMGVVFAWLVLRLGGSWKAEPGWVDLTGRVLGALWILLPLLLLSSFAL